MSKLAERLDGAWEDWVKEIEKKELDELVEMMTAALDETCRDD